MTAVELLDLRVTVAEAMGWTFISVRESGWGCGIAPGTEGPYVSLPDYPSDPAQIGPMLEHFRKAWDGRGNRWEITDCGDGNWRVDVIDDTHSNGSPWAVRSEEVPTLELAICLAIAEYIRAEGTDNAPGT